MGASLSALLRRVATLVRVVLVPLARVLWRRLTLQGPKLPSWTLRFEVAVEIIRAIMRPRAVPRVRTPSELRARIPRIRRMMNQNYERLPAGTHTEDVRVPVSDERRPPLRARFVWVGERDAQREAPVVLYAHGGGYLFGSIDTHKALMARIAAAARVRVLGIDYSLAPELPFPNGILDVVDTVRWLRRERGESRVVLAGDSAGGGLVLAAALHMRDEMRGEPPVDGLVLLSPWVDLTLSNPSWAEFFEFDYLPHDSGLAGPRLYADTAALNHPLVSPVFADHSGLPPVLIHVGSHETLVGEARDITAKMRSTGVDVRLEVWQDMVHVFQMFEVAPKAAESIASIARFVIERGAEPDAAALAKSDEHASPVAGLVRTTISSAL